jgi:lysophospholipase L1-like esterase
VIRPILPLGVAILLGLASASHAGPPFELVDGDRVVLIGGTLIERDQAHGYLETRLTRRYPGRSITFRNLGWSGDTVGGPSRARFGTPAEGFKHLVEHVQALKPTVIVLGYGANEAFEGRAGLTAFRQGLDTLLAAVAPSGTRLVFLAPNRQEDMGPPLPDPTRHNADLALYRDALKAEAEKRGAAFVDLFEALPDGTKASPRRPLTTNGIHLTPYGYWRMAAAVEEALFPAPKPPAPGEPADHPIRFAQVAVELKPIPGGYRLHYRFQALPPPPPPDGGPDFPLGGYEFLLGDMAHGRYALKVDGRAVAVGDHQAWGEGVVVRRGPEFDQSEALRAAINAKNELYFHRWRPQNETYLFGFRKHEQGRNAVEIVEFDPLIAAREAEIARLRVPVPHVYELTREGEVGR